MKKLFAPLLLLVATLLVAGCASNTDVVVSGLRADLVRLERAGSGDLAVTWRVRNPNVVPYVLTKASLKLSLNGQLVGTVNDPTRIGVPTAGQIEHTSILKAGEVKAAAVVDQAVAQGSAAYALDAALWVLLLEDKEDRFHLSATGTIPVTTK